MRQHYSFQINKRSYTELVLLEILNGVCDDLYEQTKNLEIWKFVGMLSYLVKQKIIDFVTGF